MANQGNHGKDKGHSPTWSDVSRMIERMEEEYGGHVEIVFDREGTRRLAEAMWVYARLYPGWHTLCEKPTDVARAMWPTSSCKEMPSLCFRLLYQLSHMADARREAAARQGL